MIGYIDRSTWIFSGIDFSWRWFIEFNRIYSKKFHQNHFLTLKKSSMNIFRWISTIDSISKLSMQMKSWKEKEKDFSRNLIKSIEKMKKKKHLWKISIEHRWFWTEVTSARTFAFVLRYGQQTCFTSIDRSKNSMWTGRLASENRTTMSTNEITDSINISPQWTLSTCKKTSRIGCALRENKKEIESEHNLSLVVLTQKRQWKEKIMMMCIVSIELTDKSSSWLTWNWIKMASKSHISDLV